MPAKGSQDTSLGHHQERACLLLHPTPLWAPPFTITSLQAVTPEHPLRVTFHYYSLARTVTEREEGGLQQAGLYTIWVWFQTRMTKVLADIRSPPQWSVYNRGSWTKIKYLIHSPGASMHAKSQGFFYDPSQQWRSPLGECASQEMHESKHSHQGGRGTLLGAHKAFITCPPGHARSQPGYSVDYFYEQVKSEQSLPTRLTFQTEPLPGPLATERAPCLNLPLKPGNLWYWMK